VSYDIVNTLSWTLSDVPLARLVITVVRVEGRSKNAVTCEYGISRRWVHELVGR
jgi:hypothetical protein